MILSIAEPGPVPLPADGALETINVIVSFSSLFPLCPTSCVIGFSF